MNEYAVTTNADPQLSTPPNGDVDTSNFMFRPIIGPNIAATALRRLVDVRPDFNNSRKPTDDEKYRQEIETAHTLVSHLLQYLELSLDAQIHHTTDEK